MENKKNYLTLKEKDDGYFMDGIQLTNFTLQIKKVILPNNLILFIIEINKGEEKYIITVTSLQFFRKKFLQELPVFISDEEKFYKAIRSAILEKEFSEYEVLYQTGSNGLQTVNGKLMYVYTNGSLDKEGFHPEVYSGIEGAYFPENAVMDLKGNKKAVHDLFEIYNRNPEIFYSLFLFVIMGISNAYFRKIGEANFMKVTLWLDGASGSGKTELVKSAGNYTFSDEGLNRELISATCRRSYALRRLGESSGITCILDDVKNECVRERKNSVKNIIDDFVRSAYQGRITDSGSKNRKPLWIDTCVIITGEYFETNESQNARTLYLKVNGFLKNEENSKSLRALQENTLLLTTVCSGYIMWLLNKIEESNFTELIKSKLSMLRNSSPIYKGINNAERLNENRHMLEMSAILAEKYFNDISMPENFTSCFNKNVQRCINNICDDTFYLLGGESMVVLKVIERIFTKCRIRKARYQKPNIGIIQYEYCQEYFCVSQKDDFVWIDDYKESLLKKNQGGHDKYNEPPYLLIREVRFMELFDSELRELLQEKEFSSQIIDKIQSNLLKLLRKMQIIYKQNRSDSAWGRPAVDYPVYQVSTYHSENRNYGNEDDYYNRSSTQTIFSMSLEPVIQINTLHPCINTINERFKNDNYSNDFIEDIGSVQVKQMRREDIYKARQAFTSGKSLYRE